MAGNSFSQSKEMIFAWCKDGQHDRCRKQYGGDRIVCVCDCATETHGINYTPINKAMTENELDTSLASINAIMFGNAGDGESENRAVRSDSSVWGDQVKEGNKTGGYRKVGNTGVVTGYNTSTVSVSGPNKRTYEWPEALDAKNIQELEERRANRKLGTYDNTGFDAWI